MSIDCVRVAISYWFRLTVCSPAVIQVWQVLPLFLTFFNECSPHTYTSVKTISLHITINAYTTHLRTHSHTRAHVKEAIRSGDEEAIVGNGDVVAVLCQQTNVLQSLSTQRGERLHRRWATLVWREREREVECVCV